MHPTVLQSAPVLNFKFSSERIKLLRTQGVDSSVFQTLRRPFLLDDALESITPHIPKWLPEDFSIPKTSVRRQIQACYKMMANPMYGSPIICIGSMVTDERAKFLAMTFMDIAISQMKQGAQKGKRLPLWHRILGNYQDTLRDAKEPLRYGMLVLTNVAPDSTQVKLEKLRDILEIYENVPRIVVVNGSDPVSFFAEKVRLPLERAFFLNNKGRYQSNGLLDI